MSQPTPPRALSALGLPDVVVHAYNACGIRELYPWQAECLAVEGVRDGRNLVYCAPTSGGKTLVSEILLLQRVITTKKRAIFVLPYVSIVAEKTAYLQNLCKGTNVSVKGFHSGSSDSFKERFDVAVCTIEKANGLVNRLVEDGTLGESLCTYVVDEIHLVGDGSRGYLVEVSLSKVLHLTKDVQVVGMSATLPNVDDLARWLRGALYSTNYRPVPLREFVLVSGKLLNPDGTVDRELSCGDVSESARAADKTGLIEAANEVTREGHSVLVFCSSKVKCEKVAELLANWLPPVPTKDAQVAGRKSIVDQMKQQVSGFDPTLVKTVPHGVAFHHSGLTTQERALVEKGYREGLIVAICATSTLAAGVNLPARRVIFQTPYMGRDFLDATQYRQMAGRAGRAGQGALGESVLIASTREQRQVMTLVSQALPQVSSCLQDGQRGLKRLLLEVLSVTSLGTGQDLINFCASTLLCAQKAAGHQLTGDPMKDHPEIASAIQWLLKYDMVRLDERAQAYFATPLGRAVCASSLEPQQGYFLWQELERARPCISLDTDLHICYLVTPPDGHIAVDWSIYRRVLQHLSSAERRVAERVGIRLDLVDQAGFQGRLAQPTLASLDGIRLKRFYSSLVLWGVLHEMPPHVLLQRFALGRGNLQQLQQSAASFTNTVATFCKKLQWYTMEALILSFQQRLTFGVRLEIVPLMQIPGMDCVVARALYEHGFTTPVVIAGATPTEILRVLRKTLPHNVPSAVLPEANAQRLIDAAKALAKESVTEKRRQARETRKRLLDDAKQSQVNVPQPSKRSRLDMPRQDAQSQLSGSRALGSEARPQRFTAIQVKHGRSSSISKSPTLSNVPQRALVADAQLQQPSCKLPQAQQVNAQQVMPFMAQPTVQQQPSIRLEPVQIAANMPAPEVPFAELENVGSSAARLQRSLEKDSSNNRHEIQVLSSSSLGNATNSRRMQLLSKSSPVVEVSGSPQAVAGLTMDPSPSPVPRTLEDVLANCATPCRAGESTVPRGSPEVASPLSSAQLSEGLRRVGRQSLTPRDIEAVGGELARSPGHGEPHAQAESRRKQSFGVVSGKGSARSIASSGSSSASSVKRQHAAVCSETAFMRSTFAQSQTHDGLQVPVLHLVSPGDLAGYGRVKAGLASCLFVGAAAVATPNGTDLMCLTLGPTEAYCIVLSPGTPQLGLAELWHWFSSERHLCVTPDAKDLTGLLLRQSESPQCAFAEPRIAHWLLDPDDKQHVSVSDIATLFGVSLSQPEDGSSRIGSVSSLLEPSIASNLRSNWTESFLALPLMATLLRQLEAQMLHDSFWRIEMPIASVLAWMEHVGIACNPRDQQYMHSHILYKLAALQEHVKMLVGRRVLLTSAEDVGRALFEDLELPLPRGTHFRRKTNGRIAYKSSVEVLKKLQPHPVVDCVLEHRHLSHAVRRIEVLAQAGEPPRATPVCSQCKSSCTRGSIGETTSSGSSQLALGRARTDLVQTATATGRLATGAGSLPLLCLDNAFEVREVQRPSLHEELCAGHRAETGTRVFTAAATEPPPHPRRLREGILQVVGAASCADPFPGGSMSLASYWADHGWSSYTDEQRAQAVKQVSVRHGNNVLSYPADQVWRLAAPVSVSSSTPMLAVNPRQLLCAEHGHVMLSVDYSQLEVRLMAHFSQDPGFVQILHSDGDVFRHVAAGWLHKPEADVTAEERSGAKRICYGLIYGIGAARLASELGISRVQAQQFQESFMREYAGVAKWIQGCRDQARRCGYVETLHGRRRFLPAIAARGANERSHAERQAVNTACQASAADLMKTAMLAIHERLLRLRVHKGASCRMAAHMLLQIHDEVLLEVAEERLDEVRDLVVSAMINAGEGLHVPLQVKWRVGKSWGHLE